MSENSEIGWTDDTFNAWWGCEKVSPGCAHCYAESWAKRFGVQWGGRARRRFYGPQHWAELGRLNRKAERAGVPRKVFVNSMADVCERLPADHPDIAAMDASRLQLRDAVIENKWLIFQFLTKRPENFELLPIDWANTPNAWAGVTVENQEQANRRIPLLLQVPAAVRFLSCEPLLEPLEFSNVTRRSDAVAQLGKRALDGIGWVIVGGESDQPGYPARPCDLTWVRQIVQQCQLSETPVFVKQLGSGKGEHAGEVRIQPVTVPGQQPGMWTFTHKKGEDANEFPTDLQIRQFPEVRHAAAT